MKRVVSRTPKSLIVRLVVTFLGVSVAMVLVVALVAYRQARSALRNQVLEHLQMIADAKEQQLNRWVEAQRGEVEYLAGLAQVRESPAAVRSFFERTRRVKRDLRELFLLSVPGAKVLVSTDPSHIGDYRVTDQYFLNGQKGTFVQNVYPSPVPPEGTPTLTIATPLRDAKGAVQSVFAAHLDLQEIDSIFTDRSGLGVTGEAYLTDRFHVFVSGTRFGRAEYPRGVRTTGIIRAVDQHESGTATYPDYRGVEVLGVYRWIGERDLALIVEMDTSEAFAPARRLLTVLVGVGVMSTLALGLLVFLAARRIARPVVAMAGTADRVAAGDFTAVAEVVTRDEIGRLAGAFNAMTIRLRDMVRAQQAHAAELESSRQLLQEVIDRSTSSIVVTDLEGRVILANKPVTEFLGRDMSEIAGRRGEELIPHVDPARRNAEFAEVLRSGKPVTVEETVEINGEERTVLISRSLLRNPQGQAFAFSSVTTEITEIKRAEAERRQFTEQLQHTQKLESLGVLAGGIAHDFNNLLTSILGHADLVLDELPQGSGSREDVSRIVMAAQRAAEMTNQMLAYAGRGKFVITAVDLNALVEQMSQLLQVSIPKKVELVYHLATRVPVIEGDPVQLQQVVMNLITNAAEAITGRIGTITLSTTLCHLREDGPLQAGGTPLPPGNYVRLVVDDSGIGMDAATLRRIFEPFFTTKFTGRGLGLAAVQGIIRSHHGALEVQSTPGKGTIFTVYFPVMVGSEAPAVAASTPAADLTGTGTILVVDDEENVRSFARRALERAGFQVLEAPDGVQALTIYRAHPAGIAAVVLDLTMPVMDGQEVLRQLRTLDPAVRVVLSSGFTEHDLAGRGVAGDVLFLQKPYLLGELLEKVREAMER